MRFVLFVVLLSSIIQSGTFQLAEATPPSKIFNVTSFRLSDKRDKSRKWLAEHYGIAPKHGTKNMTVTSDYLESLLALVKIRKSELAGTRLGLNKSLKNIYTAAKRHYKSFQAIQLKIETSRKEAGSKDRNLQRRLYDTKIQLEGHLVSYLRFSEEDVVEPNHENMDVQSGEYASKIASDMLLAELVVLPEHQETGSIDQESLENLTHHLELEQDQYHDQSMNAEYEAWCSSVLTDP